MIVGEKAVDDAVIVVVDVVLINWKVRKNVIGFLHFSHISLSFIFHSIIFG